MNVFDLFKLNGQTAIISGGARGLGAQIATTFAEAGANIIVCSRKKEACEQMSEKLEKEYGVRSLAFECDVTKAADVQHVIERTMHSFGAIDILVNNSGATWAASVLDMPHEAWEKVMNVNITGTFLMSQEAGKHMVEQHQGKIINIASIAGFGGTDPAYMNTIGYNTSKGAIMSFTKDLAAKWGQYHINVNAIAPGFFPTKMSKGLLETGQDKIIESTPLNRLGHEEDIKGPALFLASKASEYVSGDILTLDGGAHTF